MNQTNNANSAPFECFLCHNNKDKSEVRALAEELSRRNIAVWLDEECLMPGEPWMPALEKGISNSSTTAVLVGNSGIGPWQAEELYAALDNAVTKGRRVIPVLLASAPKKAPELPPFLRARQWVDLRDQRQQGGMSQLDRLVWGITGQRP